MGHGSGIFSILFDIALGFMALLMFIFTIAMIVEWPKVGVPIVIVFILVLLYARALWKRA